MAKQTNTEITGTDGPVIYYKWRGQYLTRSKGNTGRQADVAKQQARILGKASAVSAKMRAIFKPIIADATSRKQMYRFNNVLQQWLRSGDAAKTEQLDSIQLLQGFSFNNNSNTNDFYIAMPVSRTGNNELLLHIPSFDSPNPVHPLPFSGQVRLHVIATSIDVSNPADTISYESVIEMNYTGIPIAAQEVLLPVQTKPGCLTVVALEVNRIAAGVVGAMYN